MNDGPGEPSAASPNAADARPRSWALRRGVRLAALLGLVYLGVVMFMLAMENKLIFFPSVYPDGIWNPPALQFEDAWFNAPDGTRLHGWYVAPPQPRAVLLFAHGNGGNLTHRYELLQALADRDVAVLIFDYRGYGRSEGSPSEAGVLADARAARAWLAERAGVDERQIVLMGESLGGAVMVDLAARDGSRALILENTFSSIHDVAAFHYPWLPVRWLMRTRFDSAAKIADFRGPLLQIHGDADTIVPFSIGRKLFDAAGEPKELVVIAGGDHNDPHVAEYFAALDRFFDGLPVAAP